ncbi:MAG: HD domain-containing protein, partial [bacterium]|nr:HD domain-containing protein [bacterium]
EKIDLPKENKIEKELAMEIPQEIKSAMKILQKRGFEVFAVGGCVRDSLIGRKPGDWDLTGNAKPEDIQKIFPKNFYENNFGTTTIMTGSEDKILAEIEYTPFRKEGKYTDKRHPDEVVWAKTLEEDLARRDFTVNALALSAVEGIAPKIIDLFDGQKDLKKKLIRTVGEPNERFNEDALRLMRAPRFAVQLDFEIEEKTKKAIIENSEWLRAISKERIRDELVKILMTEKATDGILMLRELGLLKYIMPEVEEGWGVTQNKHHAFTVFDHNVLSLNFAAKENYNLEVRLAALLHDVGKPRTKTGEGPESHFYGHDHLSAKMAAQIMERLKFPRESIVKVIKLIRTHMFKYNTNPELDDVTTDAAVRRIIRRVGGEENIWDLAKLRLADRAGSG